MKTALVYRNISSQAGLASFKRENPMALNGPEPISVDLEVSDQTGKLVMREVFGSISLDGRAIEITRSLRGTTFFLEADGRKESITIDVVFQKWARDFLDRTPVVLDSERA